MNGLLGDESFEVDDQLYWVEQHLQLLPELDDGWVEAFSVWLGEHVIKGILDARWVERDGRWVVLSPRGVFDPEPVVRETVGSEALGEAGVMVSAACVAIEIRADALTDPVLVGDELRFTYREFKASTVRAPTVSSLTKNQALAIDALLNDPENVVFEVLSGDGLGELVGQFENVSTVTIDRFVLESFFYP